jgi:HAD superfamily hydrolase (TIGR01509 family)
MSDIAIIFDIDGLMVDTEPLSRVAWDQVLEKYGRTMDDETYTGLIGFRIDETADYLIAAYELDTDAQSLIQKKRTAYDAILAEGVPVLPGLFDLLEVIEKRGIPWGVATSSPCAHAKNILTQLGLWERCASATGGDEVSKGKPDPEIYLLAAQRLGCLPARCLALEDSAPGCQSALSAGLLTIAVPNGDTDLAKLPTVNYINDSLLEVADRFEDLMRELQER